MKSIDIEDILLTVNSTLADIKISRDQITENFVSLGIDSLTFIQMIVNLEENFECEIPDSKLIISEIDTVEKIHDMMNNLYLDYKQRSSNI